MPQLIVTTPSGAVHQLDADTGITAMVAIRDAGLEGLLALCGGVCSCATCHVHVAPEWAATLDPISDDEIDLLDSSSQRSEYSRLSCQILLTDRLDGLRLAIADEG